MNAKSIHRITWVREQAEELATLEHLRLCTCCQDDLALIREDPLTRHSDYLLDKIRVRCGLPSRRREEP